MLSIRQPMTNEPERKLHEVAIEIATSRHPKRQTGLAARPVEVLVGSFPKFRGLVMC